LAVAALPDEFPIVFTFFLGVGVYRLAHKNALVRRAVSVENIGRITCICSDKTGTMTEGRFQLIKCMADQNILENDLVFYAALASSAERGDPIDLAILAEKHKRQILVPELLASFPFTEDRKRETSLIAQSEQYLFAAKGAPETMIALCALSENEKNHWMASVSALAKEGYKVIACARRFVDTITTPPIEPTEGYQFCGLLAFSDPPRKEVFAAVQQCLASNIHILMITGDHPETARSIAQKIGMGNKNPTVMLANDAIAQLEKNSGAFLKSVDVIARAIPTQKLSFVQALQATGEIVAVTGDGVNDVPALKAADVGIAMGERGTQSAREVASIVLLDDNFGSIVNAISEGRQLFKNLKLSFKYLLMIHIPFILSAALIPLFGFPLLYHPIHIVFIELIIHPTSLLVFQELPESKHLTPQITGRKLRFFSRSDWIGIISVGFYTTLLVMVAYLLSLKAGYPTEHARGIALTLLGFTSGAITIGLSGLRSRVSQVITAGVFIMTILLVEVPLLADFLELKSLSAQDWIMITLTSILTLVLVRI
jgi:Ca2+-transporting ATPase